MELEKTLENPLDGKAPPDHQDILTKDKVSLTKIRCNPLKSESYELEGRNLKESLDLARSPLPSIFLPDESVDN